MTSVSIEPVEERDRNWRKSPGGSLMLQPQEKSPDLESAKFTAGTYRLAREGRHSREAWSSWLVQRKSSGRRSFLYNDLIPHQQPPCDTATCQSPRSHRVHETETFFRVWEGRESWWKQSVSFSLPLFSCSLTWLFHYFFFFIKSLTHCLFICLTSQFAPSPPPAHLRQWITGLGVYLS